MRKMVIDTDPAPHDWSGVGRAAHRVIARLLERREREPSREEIVAEVRTEQAACLPHVYGIAARARLTSLVSTYFRLFVPDTGSKFVGAEIPLDDAWLDLLFEGPGARLWADELKTGVSVADRDDQALEEQLGREIRGALTLFGRRFVGVRVLPLAAPSRVFFAWSTGFISSPIERPHL